MRDTTVIISCEHATNFVPEGYRYLFQGKEEILNTHRGSDMGAEKVARYFSGQWKTPLFIGTICRLVVDLNRSPKDPDLFSSFSRNLPKEEKKGILGEWYFPYREEVGNAVAEKIDKGGKVLHLSVHSFTPILHDVVRNAEIGLLYDPSRKTEADICRHWQKKLGTALPEMRVRRNYPYRGISDGFSTYLRKHYPEDVYNGIELEINQKLPIDSRLCKALVNSVEII